MLLLGNFLADLMKLGRKAGTVWERDDDISEQQQQNSISFQSTSSSQRLALWLYQSSRLRLAYVFLQCVCGGCHTQEVS